jgi:hypothetical protein
MEDLPEAGNLLHGRRRGDRHREDCRCRGDILQVLDTGRHRLDTAHQPRTRVQDNGHRQCRADLRQEGQVRYDMYFQ